MKLRISIRFLMVAVLLCAAGTNVVVQERRIRYSSYADMILKEYESPGEVYLSWFLLLVVVSVMAYMALSSKRRK